jgi:RNA polymerase sigma factor (sigma-70 family)
MATAGLTAVVRHIRDLAEHSRTGHETDDSLLRAFLSGNDESAFETLVRRHGPMVLRVCRRTLGNAHDAEDALQATFLVLAQNAASIRRRESLANRLYGVAHRMATNARRSASRRHRHEARATTAPVPDPELSAAWKELQKLLDEEITGLPEGLRAPFILFCLESKSYAQAAQQLGIEEGTLRRSCPAQGRAQPCAADTCSSHRPRPSPTCSGWPRCPTCHPATTWRRPSRSPPSATSAAGAGWRWCAGG